MDDRDPLAYAPFWRDRRLRRRVLGVALINVLLVHLLLLRAPYGAAFVSLATLLAFLLAAWYAGGFRCPRCKYRFAGQRLALLLAPRCAHCGLFVDAMRDLDEPPLFPELRDRSVTLDEDPDA